MNLILKSIVFAFSVHLLYTVVLIGYGYWQTKKHVPNLLNNGTHIQSEVSFGYTASPFMIATFISTMFLFMVAVKLVSLLKTKYA